MRFFCIIIMTGTIFSATQCMNKLKIQFNQHNKERCAKKANSLLDAHAQYSGANLNEYNFAQKTYNLLVKLHVYYTNALKLNAYYSSIISLAKERIFTPKNGLKKKLRRIKQWMRILQKSPYEVHAVLNEIDEYFCETYKSIQEMSVENYLQERNKKNLIFMLQSSFNTLHNLRTEYFNAQIPLHEEYILDNK